MKPAGWSWNPIPFSLRQCVSEAVGTMIIRQPKRASRYPPRCAKISRIAGSGIRIGVRQVLLNLANNAVKFTSLGFVRAEVSMQSSIGDETELRFDVTDTGIGLSAPTKADLRAVSSSRRFRHAQVRGHRIGLGHLLQSGEDDARWPSPSLVRLARAARFLFIRASARHVQSQAPGHEPRNRPRLVRQPTRACAFCWPRTIR